MCFDWWGTPRKLHLQISMLIDQKRNPESPSHLDYYKREDGETSCACSLGKLRNQWNQRHTINYYNSVATPNICLPFVLNVTQSQYKWRQCPSAWREVSVLSFSVQHPHNLHFATPPHLCRERSPGLRSRVEKADGDVVAYAQEAYVKEDLAAVPFSLTSARSLLFSPRPNPIWSRSTFSIGPCFLKTTR